MDKQTYAILNKKIKGLVSGVQSASVSGATITFTMNDGSKQSITFPAPKDGLSITDVDVNADNTLTCTLSDGSTVTTTNKIKTVKGDKGDKLTFNDLTDAEKESLKGDDGFSPTITENVNNTDKIYKLDITTADTTFTTPNLKGADGQGGSGGSGEENVIDSISVNGVNVEPDENKNVDITVPTKTSDLSNDSGFLTQHQDISGKVDKVEGKSLISDTEISRLASVDNYDDTLVKSQIQAVANGLMDSVGYSADYKTIDIIAKNGVKKSVNVAPIISHASITELSDVDITNKDNGKALVYNSATGKHEYTTISSTDEKVKMDSSSDSKYLGELLDNVTIINENGELKVKKLDGQEVTITEINYLKGLTMNVMDLVNMFSNGGVKIINTPVATYAELLTIDKSAFIEGISYLVYVLADENHDNAKTTYLVDKDSETPTYFGFADSQRDFTTNPIDLATEITGKLGIGNMDSDAIKALFTVDDTYKTETATNNAFSTHGAKALYDELLLAIGNKANDSDLTAHKDDTDIHVSTEDRTKWDSAKTHADSAHAPSDAQENVIETVKVNNQEIIADENKAVNIDLSGYAEHDEIVGENLIPYPYAQPERTTNGITFTFADDGSVIANGTATADADFSVSVRTNFGTDKAFMLKPGAYAITGCPEGGSDSTYRIHVQFGDKSGVKYTLKADYGKGFVFEVTEEHAQYACQIQCHVQRGYTVTDLVFKPMLVLGSVLREYQPYKLSREALRTDIADVTELASRVDNQFSTASGDYITVNDSVDGKLVELGIKGNSFQKSYAGYNLLPYPFYNTSKKVGNITVTDNKDGSITVNGTNGDSAVNVFDYVFRNHTFKAGTYHVSGVGRGWIGTYTVGTTNQIYASQIYDGEITFTVDADFDLLLRSTCDANGSYANVTYHPMIVKVADDGSYPTEYEPYVGGIPSPNPLYPQTINSVGDDGNIVVKSCGKNLIPYPYTHGGGNYKNVTITINDDRSITLNGTNSEDSGDYGFAGVSSFSAMKYMVRLKEGHTYRLSVEFFSGSLPDTSRIIINGWNDYSYVRGLASCSSKATSFTFTVPVNSGIKWGCIYLQNRQGHVFDNVRLRPMLVEVSEDGTYPTEYEFYNGSASTITLSEPLRAIGDIKDEITYQDGKWGVLRRIKRINANDLSWYAYSDYVFGNGFTSDIMPKSGTKAYCNIAKVNYPMTNDWAEFCFTGVTSTSDCHLNVRDTTTFPTITEWNTYIASNDVYFDYPLATPVFEPFADQTLPYLSTYDGVTNISNDDALSAEMTVKYPLTDVGGAGSRNEAKIAEIENDVDELERAIGNTDISAISDGTVTGGLSTIYNRINSASISERIDIKSEAATQYFAPCDGYVYLINNSGQTGTVSLFGNCAIGGNMGHFSCFVPAGTRIVIGGTINQLYFCKLQY